MNTLLKKHGPLIYTILNPLRWWWLQSVNRFYAPVRGVLVTYSDRRRAKIFDLVTKIKREQVTLMQPNEGYQLHSAVTSTAKIPGDIAEVGVYKGGSAKIIAEAMGKKTLHLFDTFEGLPEPSKHDHFVHTKGLFSASLAGVKHYLRTYKHIRYYQGIFPASAKHIPKRKYSFVHLDIDLYEGTKDSLAYFYPKMSRGGIMMSHDYAALPGVKKAVDEFFLNKPEVIVELSGYQCLIVKI